MPIFLCASDRRIRQRRPLPAGCDQQHRFETRTHRVCRVPAAEEGGADPVADDQAERHSAWGAEQEFGAPRPRHAGGHTWAPLFNALALCVAWAWSEHWRGIVLAGVVVLAVAAAAFLVLVA